MKIELSGGPLCGRTVEWDRVGTDFRVPVPPPPGTFRVDEGPPDLRIEVDVYEFAYEWGGVAVYRYRGRQK